MPSTDFLGDFDGEFTAFGDLDSFLSGVFLGDSLPFGDLADSRLFEGFDQKGHNYRS